MGKNSVQLAGTITMADFKISGKGTPYLRFTVKTPRSNGRDAYVDVVAFDDVATENQSLRQGDTVDVLGEVTRSKNNQTNQWETRIVGLVVKRFGNSQPQQHPNQSYPSRDDDVPF